MNQKNHTYKKNFFILSLLHTVGNRYQKIELSWAKNGDTSQIYHHVKPQLLKYLVLAPKLPIIVKSVNMCSNWLYHSFLWKISSLSSLKAYGSQSWPTDHKMKYPIKSMLYISQLCGINYFLHRIFFCVVKKYSHIFSVGRILYPDFRENKRFILSASTSCRKIRSRIN